VKSPEARSESMSRQDVIDLAIVFERSTIRVQSDVTGQWQLTEEARETIAAALRAYSPLEKAIPNSARDTILEETALALEDADQALVDEIGAHHFVRSLKRGADVVQIHGERGSEVK
jgi:hypothetical protein